VTRWHKLSPAHPPQYALPALRTIGNICAGSEGGAAAVVADPRSLPGLQRLLLSANRSAPLKGWSCTLRGVGMGAWQFAHSPFAAR
jgi:hypothetical protein